MNVLEVRFRQEGGGWRVQAVPEGSAARAERVWRASADPRTLYWTLFDARDEEIHRGPWRVRVAPQELVPTPGELPAAPWSELRHPQERAHVFDLGWTLAEVTAPPVDVTWNGRVLVRGDAALCTALRRQSVPGVEEHTAVTVPARSVLIVADAHADPALLQRAAEDCALVIWCRQVPATRGAAMEVVPAATTDRDAQVRWMTHLLSALRRGDDPECALRHAAITAGGGDFGAWWLRGVCRTWKVDLPDAARRSPRWRTEIDRAAQEGLIKRQIVALTRPEQKRRVVVFFVPASPDAGLSWFRQRDLGADARVAGPVDELAHEVPWARSTPGETFDELLRCFGVRNLDDLVERLARKASHGRMLLVRVNHPVASAVPNGEHPHLDATAVEYYLLQLQRFADALAARSTVRCAVIVPVEGTLNRLPPPRPGDEVFVVMPVPPMPTHVASADLEAWMLAEELEPDDDKRRAFLLEVENDSYEVLIQKLEARYPEKLRQ